MELQGKPDFEESLRRIEAWFAGERFDRPPVRFSEHNSDFSAAHALAGRTWPSLKDRWFDAEFQVEYFLESIRGRTFYGETFPVFWPNLGPNVYAAVHGAELDFGEVTSWIRHCVHRDDDLAALEFRRDNEYFRGIETLTQAALERCAGKFMVGYADLHGSLDCVADWRDPQELCLVLLEAPERVRAMLRLANENFLPVFDHYDSVLKAHGQCSVTWIGVTSRGRFHVSSCDFTTNVSTQFAVLLATARLFGELMKRYDQPPVFGELLAGIVLGPSLLGWIAPPVFAFLFPPDPQQYHLLELISWLGMIFLLLFTGLELDVSVLKSLRRPAIFASLFGIALPFASGLRLDLSFPTIWWQTRRNG